MVPLLVPMFLSPPVEDRGPERCISLFVNHRLVPQLHRESVSKTKEHELRHRQNLLLHGVILIMAFRAQPIYVEGLRVIVVMAVKSLRGSFLLTPRTEAWLIDLSIFHCTTELVAALRFQRFNVVHGLVFLALFQKITPQ